MLVYVTVYYPLSGSGILTSSKRCRCGVPLQRTRSRLPAVPTNVTVGADNPRGLASPFDVFIGERGRGLFRNSPPPASALVLANSALAVLPRAAVLLHPFECHCHPSVGFGCPSGLSPEDNRRASPSCDGLRSAPLMGFCSLQRSPAQRIRFLSRDFHIPSRCVLRVRALSTP